MEVLASQELVVGVGQTVCEVISLVVLPGAHRILNWPDGHGPTKAHIHRFGSLWA
jgi:hypothetical protein